MKTIYKIGQIEELASLSPAERRALLWHNQFKRFRHWQGWAGAVAHMASIAAIVFARNIHPEGAPWWWTALYIATLVALGMWIYIVTYYTTIAPYVRHDIARLHNQGFALAATIGRTMPSSVPQTRGTPPAGQEPRHGSRSAHG